MRARSERVLYQADLIAGQVAGILVRGRTEIERTVTNVRDATDWADKLVQKIYANPFVLSPFYKPNPEDIRVAGGLRHRAGVHQAAPRSCTTPSRRSRPSPPGPPTRSSSRRSRNSSRGSWP